MHSLRTYWAQFWALPWARKGPAIAAVALVPLIVAGVVLALTRESSDGGDTSVSTTSTPAAPQTSASAATPPAVPPTETPAGDPPPEVDSTGRPAAYGYRLAPAMRNVADNGMLGFVAFPGRNRQGIVVTQGGMLWRASTNDSFQPQEFGDLRGRLIDNPGNEEGLLGFAFSPDYGSDRRVYVYYTAGDPRRSVLSRFTVANNTNRMNTGSERVLLTVPQPFPNHNGGQIAFGPDRMLYVGLGDGGLAGDPEGNGQNRATLLGSILRLNVSGNGDYSVPPENPFVGQPDVRGEIWAFGFRNPWRFSFDRQTGALWAGDVGQDAFEEVDIVVRGGNYGWNILEGNSCYAGPCGTGGLRAPRAVYGHDQGCSVTGGYVYRGSALPELRGWYIYGDYCTGRIWAVSAVDNSPPVVLADSGEQITAFGELANGEIIAITSGNAIYRLARS